MNNGRIISPLRSTCIAMQVSPVVSSLSHVRMEAEFDLFNFYMARRMKNLSINQTDI